MKYIVNFLSISLVLIFSNYAVSQSTNEDVIINYIEKYKEIAVSEMDSTGIPASIKLAQGILESNAGRSKLAREANNHFGIKCGGNWNGGTFYRKDDDYKNGRLVKSCFREYEDGIESFIEHSEFLRDPKKQYRYGFLFNLSVSDYTSWARGLRKAGYATNPKYASLLINIIEKYNLNKLDQEIELKEIQIVADVSYMPKALVVNDVKYVLARAGETPLQISRDFGVSVSRILNYNENISSKNQVLPQGARVFLQKKRASYRGRKKKHYVKQGETMYSISQLYGLDLKKLLKKNKMNMGEEPAIGEQVVLRGLNLFGEAPILKSKKNSIIPPAPDRSLPKDEDIEAENPDLSIPLTQDEINQNADDHIIVMNKPKDKSKEYNEVMPRYYTVKKGDTLYGISKTYSIKLEDLKRINKLSDNTINPGQVIRIK